MNPKACPLLALILFIMFASGLYASLFCVINAEEEPFLDAEYLVTY